MTPHPTGTWRRIISLSRISIKTYRSSVNLLDVRRVRSGFAQTFSRVKSSGEFLDVLRFPRLVHVAERHVTEEQQAGVVGPVGAAVVGRLGDHVGEIDT